MSFVVNLLPTYLLPFPVLRVVVLVPVLQKRIFRTVLYCTIYSIVTEVEKQFCSVRPAKLNTALEALHHYYHYCINCLPGLQVTERYKVPELLTCVASCCQVRESFMSQCVRSVAIEAGSVKITAFWHVTLCSLLFTELGGTA
jgi:hypothetical protein